MLEGTIRTNPMIGGVLCKMFVELFVANNFCLFVLFSANFKLFNLSQDLFCSNYAISNTRRKKEHALGRV